MWLPGTCSNSLRYFLTMFCCTVAYCILLYRCVLASQVDLRSDVSSADHLSCSTPAADNDVPMLCAQSCPTLCDPTGCSPPGSPVHGDPPDKNPQVGSLPLLQGNFPTQESNRGLLPCRRTLYQLSQQGRRPGQPPIPDVASASFLGMGRPTTPEAGAPAAPWVESECRCGCYLLQARSYFQHLALSWVFVFVLRHPILILGREGEGSSV